MDLDGFSLQHFPHVGIETSYFCPLCLGILICKVRMTNPDKTILRIIHDNTGCTWSLAGTE